MTKEEFKVKALEVLKGIKHEYELKPFVYAYEYEAGKGCLGQRVLGKIDVSSVFDTDWGSELMKLIPDSAARDFTKIAPLAEIRKWVESL